MSVTSRDRTDTAPNPVPVDRVPEVLAHLGFPGPWTVAVPDRGITGRTVFADAASGRMVVKFSSVATGCARVAELGLAPAVLGQGHWHDQPVHVQQYLDGGPRSWAWMAEHVDEVVQLVARYQTDATLTQQLAADHDTDLATHRAALLDETCALYAHAVDPALHDAQVHAAVDWLITGATRHNGAALVPSHTDTNHTNVLDLGDRIVLVDWDDLCLSDPSRDLGIMLWWYCATPDFDRAWQALGLPVDEWPAATDRAYWWVGLTSLRAALWNDRHDGGSAVIESFLEDLLAASRHQGNPKHQGSTKPVVT